MSEKSTNMELWNKVRRTDPKYTKPFSNGQYGGTTITPTFMFRKATEAFGPFGIGWGIHEQVIELVDGAPLSVGGNAKLVSCQLTLFYHWKGEEGKISHFGNSMLLRETANNKIVFDENAFKKARTDAMKKCLFLIGIGEEITLGEFDNPSYVEAAERYARDEEQRSKHENKLAMLKGRLENVNGCGATEDSDKDVIVKWVTNGKHDWADCHGDEAVVDTVVSNLNAKAKDGGIRYVDMLATARESVGAPKARSRKPVAKD